VGVEVTQFHIMAGVIFLLAGVGLGTVSRWCVDWVWAKTHPGYRRFTFHSHTGHLWTFRGKWLKASQLTDQLQNLHDETAAQPRGRSRILEGSK
jgi:hypothetical protein